MEIRVRVILNGQTVKAEDIHLTEKQEKAIQAIIDEG